VARESELLEIIEGKSINVKKKKYSARSYYGANAAKYDFSVPVQNSRTGILVGHILPKKEAYMQILEFFRK
jgi:hypothetical protein